MKKYRYISRIDNNTTHCWFVRVLINKEKRYINASFADKKLGGKCAALAKAYEWRDKQVRRRGKVDYNYGQVLRVAFTKNSNNTSGVIGISTTWKNHKSGYSYLYYEATWYDPQLRKQCKKVYSAHQYGEAIAFLKCCEIRYKNSGTLYVRKGAELPAQIKVPFAYVQ